jgi:hypothetical protein
MPTAERYSRYREDQTTIWVSKTAADTLSRERNAPGEGAAAVLDRLLNELRKLRRGSGGGGGATGGSTGGATKSATTKSAPKTASKGAAKGGATRGSKTAKKAGAKTAKAARR